MDHPDRGGRPNGAFFASNPVGDFVCGFCGKPCTTEQGRRIHIGKRHKQENSAKQGLSSTGAVAPNKSAMFVCKDAACKFTKATTIKEGEIVGETNPWRFQ